MATRRRIILARKPSQMRADAPGTILPNEQWSIPPEDQGYREGPGRKRQPGDCPADVCGKTESEKFQGDLTDLQMSGLCRPRNHFVPWQAVFFGLKQIPRELTAQLGGTGFGLVAGRVRTGEHPL
jgi:hypothetical protein